MKKNLIKAFNLKAQELIKEYHLPNSKIAGNGVTDMSKLTTTKDAKGAVKVVPEHTNHVPIDHGRRLRNLAIRMKCNDVEKVAKEYVKQFEASENYHDESTLASIERMRKKFNKNIKPITNKNKQNEQQKSEKTAVTGQPKAAAKKSTKRNRTTKTGE